MRLTVLACETGGRWSQTCLTVVRLLARAKARNAPEEAQARVAAAWASRWWSLLAIAGRNTLAATIVDDAPQLLDGVDGETPLWTDVLLDAAELPNLHDPAPELDDNGGNWPEEAQATIGRAL